MMQLHMQFLIIQKILKTSVFNLDYRDSSAKKKKKKKGSPLYEPVLCEQSYQAVLC